MAISFNLLHSLNARNQIFGYPRKLRQFFWFSSHSEKKPDIIFAVNTE